MTLDSADLPWNSLESLNWPSPLRSQPRCSRLPSPCVPTPSTTWHRLSVAGQPGVPALQQTCSPNSGGHPHCPPELQSAPRTHAEQKPFGPQCCPPLQFCSANEQAAPRVQLTAGLHAIVVGVAPLKNSVAPSG